MSTLVSSSRNSCDPGNDPKQVIVDVAEVLEQLVLHERVAARSQQLSSGSSNGTTAPSQLEHLTLEPVDPLSQGWIAM